MSDPASLALQEENTRLRQELAQLSSQREKERASYESKVAAEQNLGKSYTETLQQRSSEIESLKSKMVRLTRQLDEEVTRRDQVHIESQRLERKLQEMSARTGSTALPSTTTRRGSKDTGKKDDDEHALRERSSQVSMKLMRVVDQWMRQKDLQQALLRGASINDTAFSTLVQALTDCPSLQTVDLSQNLLTMDSCSDICLLVTTAPSLSFISLADNLFSLRSIGYFMTAVMERQNTKKLMPLDLLDLQGNEGLVASAVAPIPEGLLRQVQGALSPVSGKLPPHGVELVAQVMRALWRFLHDTSHPQVRDTTPDEVAFQVMDKITFRKMENALMKILLMGVDGPDLGEGAAGGVGALRPVTANLALMTALESERLRGGSPRDVATAGSDDERRGRQAAAQGDSGSLGNLSPARRSLSSPAQAGRGDGRQDRLQRAPRGQATDPFSDLKMAFEPPREKAKTFNLKQIVTRNGTVLMNMLERLLETTEIDAHDVETDQTLLEYACQTGNLGLAKFCYRRGANLSAKTRKGETPFNIVTHKKRYDIMEFLHTYGVKVASCDSQGKCALHIAAANDDVDGICRLLEWGADVNCYDNRKRTPIHDAAAGGNMKATMLLLEVGANMNAKDDREYTAVAHAEAKNHFVLMDRLVQLGGRGHGLHQKKDDLAKSRSAKRFGELPVSAGMLKSTSLGRIGKVAVEGMSGRMTPSCVR